VLGHLTYPLRYARRAGLDIDFTPYYDRIADLYELLIKRDKGIELNTSCVAELGFFMPDENLIRLYHQRGGKIITVGSDAHNAQNVGNHIQEAIELLKFIGFEAVTTFEKRIPLFQSI